MSTRTCLVIAVLLALALSSPPDAAAEQSDPPQGEPTSEAPETEADKPARKFEVVLTAPLTAAERRAKREADSNASCEHYTGSRLQREGSQKKRCPEAPGVSLKRSDMDKDNTTRVGDLFR